MKTLCSFLGILLALSTVTESRAVDFSNVDLKPLFHLHLSKRFKTPPEFPPQKEIFDDEDLFVTQGGATVLIIFLRSEDTEFGTRMVRVVSPQPPLRTFLGALAASRIGLQPSCESDTGGTLTGSYEISWYGRHGRSNSFHVALAAAGASGLPPCPPEAQQIVMAVAAYESDVVGAPGAEVFQSQ